MSSNVLRWGLDSPQKPKVFDIEILGQKGHCNKQPACYLRAIQEPRHILYVHGLMDMMITQHDTQVTQPPPQTSRHASSISTPLTAITNSSIIKNCHKKINESCDSFIEKHLLFVFQKRYCCCLTDINKVGWTQMTVLAMIRLLVHPLILWACRYLCKQFLKK